MNNPEKVIPLLTEQIGRNANSFLTRSLVLLAGAGKNAEVTSQVNLLKEAFGSLELSSLDLTRVVERIVAATIIEYPEKTGFYTMISEFSSSWEIRELNQTNQTGFLHGCCLGVFRAFSTEVVKRDYENTLNLQEGARFLGKLFHSYNCPEIPKEFAGSLSNFVALFLKADLPRTLHLFGLEFLRGFDCLSVSKLGSQVYREVTRAIFNALTIKQRIVALNGLRQ